MEKTSVWKKVKYPKVFTKITENITVDVAIIGGGITGITTAYLLASQGKKVAVLETMQVAESTTGLSTGNLYATVDEDLHKLQNNFDTKTIQQVAESRLAAMNLIEEIKNKSKIECDFKTVPWYLFSETPDNNKTIENEIKAAKEAGLDASAENNFPLPFKVSSAMRIEKQAQFNPYIYVKELASNIHKENCKIYENSKVIEIQEGTPHVLITENAKITATHIIHATHVPKGFSLLQTLLGPYREYALAFKLNDTKIPEGIFWGMNKGHHYSMRKYSHNNENYLLILGEPHKVGQKENNEECFSHLEKYVKEKFNVGPIEYKWAAQHFKSADGLPYIGKSMPGSTVYYATGFSTDGLTYGTLAAVIITDLIMGKESNWSKLYDPCRFNPLISAKDFIKENANVAMQYIKDLSMDVDVKHFEQIKAGEGKTIEVDGHRCAAFRDENNKLHVVSAVCPHLKCIVNWNTAEKTWDCPCHGSRFTVDGEVIEGPAIGNLDKKNIKS